MDFPDQRLPHGPALHLEYDDQRYSSASRSSSQPGTRITGNSVGITGRFATRISTAVNSGDGVVVQPQMTTRFSNSPTKWMDSRSISASLTEALNAFAL